MIDIIVTNYHTEDDLQRFLESFARHGPKDGYSLTVIDVDVEPYERHIPPGRQAAFLGGRRFGVAGNIGYARACNLGAALTNGDVVAFFNADTFLIEDRSIEECAGALLANARWGVLGPRQISSAGKFTHAGIFGTHQAPRIRGWQEFATNTPQGPKYTNVEQAISVAGSVYFVKRECWDTLAECPVYRLVAPDAEGAFLPTPHYYEETWCSYHAWHHGWMVMYYGRETFGHEWHKASPVGGKADTVHMKESRRLFREACDHHGIPHD